jgi:hypothetical protein
MKSQEKRGKDEKVNKIQVLLNFEGKKAEVI